MATIKDHSVIFLIGLAGLLLFPAGNLVLAQFHPAADQPGTSAIHKDSSVFVKWGSSLESFHRGCKNISAPANGLASHGAPTDALGKANDVVVSLGDSGHITIGFDTALLNGPGWDFAVFSNPFDHYFLELAFVEVSTNGTDFVRFPATSLTDTAVQKGSFDTLSPQKIDNLAGKYIKYYGTPFDLQELKDSAAININQINYIRIIDVIGSLTDSIASYDPGGRKINDPFPTCFATGGFDLDAIGVIHNQNTSGYFTIKDQAVKVFPNPADDHVNIRSDRKISGYRLSNINGRVLYSKKTNNRQLSVRSSQLPEGMYLLHVQSGANTYTHKICIQH
ncbi:MAG: T9SS type A sorting domain-containing protein [Bacteroidales bacterium]